MNRLYHEVWCGRIHFGLWLDEGDTITTAAARTPVEMARSIGLRDTDWLLEVGSGRARTAMDLALAFGCPVIATNHSPAHRALADAAIAEQGLDHLVSSATADAERLPFPNNVFSAYWAQEVLIHLGDKALGFREAYRVLTPGGRIVFTEQTTRKAALSATERARVVARHGSDDLWDREDFVASMRSAGFERIRTVDWSAHLTRHFAALVRRIEDSREALERDCGDDLVASQLDNWKLAEHLASTGKFGWHLFIGDRD